MKKIIVMLCLLASLMIVTMVPAYASFTEENLLVQSKEHYNEELSITFDNSMIDSYALESIDSPLLFKKNNYVSQAIKQFERQNVEINLDALYDVIDASVSEDNSLISINVKNVYYAEGVEDGIIYSKLMTEDEVRQLNEENGIAAPASHIGTYYDSMGKLTLIVALSTQEISGKDIAYLVATTATWEDIKTDESIYPASGLDALCFNWGGELNRYSSSATITAFNGNSIGKNEVGFSANKSYGWSFYDYDGVSASRSAMERMVSRIILTKNHAVDELTELYVTYVHTYKAANWNFSVGVSADGNTLAGGVTISPETETKYWSVMINIMNIPY